MHSLPPVCAKALRDGGIDATAALDHALSLAVGKTMAAVMEQMLAPAIRAYPELEPNDTTWRAVALERARARAVPAPLPGPAP